MEEQASDNAQMSSMSDVLKGNPPQETTPSPETKTEVAKATETPPPKVETQQTASTEDEAKKASGILKGIQAERRKRQALEQENQQLRAQIAGQTPFEPQTDVDPSRNEAIEQKFETKILSISESSARSAHPDFQEKFDAFILSVTDAQNPNRALYDMVMSSDHPGEAAYQAGKTLLVQKKYGIDFDSQYQSIRKESEAELRSQIRTEIEKELTGKVTQKVNQPTNILQARAAGGAESIEFRPTSFRDLLGARQR